MTDKTQTLRNKWGSGIDWNSLPNQAQLKTGGELKKIEMTTDQQPFWSWEWDPGAGDWFQKWNAGTGKRPTILGATSLGPKPTGSPPEGAISRYDNIGRKVPAVPQHRPILFNSPPPGTNLQHTTVKQPLFPTIDEEARRKRAKEYQDLILDAMGSFGGSAEEMRNLGYGGDWKRYVYDNNPGWWDNYSVQNPGEIYNPETPNLLKERGERQLAQQPVVPKKPRPARRRLPYDIATKEKMNWGTAIKQEAKPLSVLAQKKRSPWTYSSGQSLWG